MKIYIDADGSPVVDITVAVAKEYGIETIIVKNYAHQIQSDYAKIITVDVSNDSADFYIVNNIGKDDIVVTQDYGLAALCLSKNALPINQDGLIFTEDNIDGMLNRRFFHAKLRNQGKRHSNAKKRKLIEDEQFELQLRKLIEKTIANNM